MWFPKGGPGGPGPPAPTDRPRPGAPGCLIPDNEKLQTWVEEDDFQEAKSGRGKGSSAAGGGGQALFSNGGAAVHAVSFNPKMRAFFAFGDAAGGVHVLKMPEALANVKSGEEQDLAKIAGNLAEDGADE